MLPMFCLYDTLMKTDFRLRVFTFIQVFNAIDIFLYSVREISTVTLQSHLQSTLRYQEKRKMSGEECIL